MVTPSALNEGFACTLAPKVLVSDELKSGDLVARAVTDPRPVRTLHLVSLLDARPTVLREKMSELVAELVSEAVRNGTWDGARLSQR